MWRRLLARTHPDAGGDSDLFLWTRELQEKVCGRQEEPNPRRKPPRQEPPRVPFDEACRESRLVQGGREHPTLSTLRRTYPREAQGGEVMTFESDHLCRMEEAVALTEELLPTLSEQPHRG